MEKNKKTKTVMRVNSRLSFTSANGFKQIEEIESINKGSKGLGDFIEKISTFTGIKWIVDKIVGGKCSACEKRKKILNKIFPYKK